MASRNAEPSHDPRDRYGLYRLCECIACGGKGQVIDAGEFDSFADTRTGKTGYATKRVRCPDCRGEGRSREEVASCESMEAVGVALVTLAREGEWEGCPFGLLDREGEKGKRWLVLPWPSTARTVRAAAQTLARSKKPSAS